MPSALEKLVKILKLEQDTGYQNTAVIGGLESFADNWEAEAHQQAKVPEHHQLVDEMVRLMREYKTLEDPGARHETIKYMLGRIMGRIPPPVDLPPSDYVEAKPEPAPPEASQPDTPASPPDPQPPAADPEPEPPQAPQPAPAPRAHVRSQERHSPEEIQARFEELHAPVTALHRVGDKMAEKLQRLGIATIGDLLFTFPRRYDDYSQMKPLNRLQPGESVTLVAAVKSVARRVGRQGRAYLLVTLDDDTGVLDVAFFGQPWLQRQFKRGSQVVMSGTVERFRGRLHMTNPAWEMVERDNLHTGRIVPVYPLTKGLSARTMRRLVRQAIDNWADKLPDYMPQSVLDRTELVALDWALWQVHFPDSFQALEDARRRLSFDELLLFQMGMLRNRRAWQAIPARPVEVDDTWLEQLLAALPYTLTGAQQRALDGIRGDMARAVPMNRLLQGDVGSGKTVVAAAALAMATHNGHQAALMAPTSILAEQHARSIGELLRNLPGEEQIEVRLLTGNTSDAEREEIYRGLAGGWIKIVIGTHALIQSGVAFDDLALAVIDEQHRFGVEQRGILRGKGTNPHVLVMTATPIPRTLALTLYADLDLSIIDELPPGRTPVETRVLRPVERERAYSFIQSQVKKGHQAFIVYPLVEASETLDEVGAAVDEYERLAAHVFPRQRVGLLHGRMRPDEKDAIMASFAAGEIDILVSTSVVEVGIDVPNATIILIENADRFGLAQLHQFRGRVGRGPHPSFCLLIAESATPEAEQRLQAMERTTNGFELAEIDWNMRGPGDLLGVRQSGLSDFRLAEIINPRLVELAQREARTLYAEDPDLSQPEHQPLARRIQTLLDRRADIS